MFRSLHWRIAVPYMLLIIISMGLVSLYLVNFVHRNLLADLRSQLVSEAKLIAELGSPYLDDMAQRQALEELALRLGQRLEAGVTFIDPQGQVLADSQKSPIPQENLSSLPEVKEALDKGESQATRYSPTAGIQEMYLAVPIKREGQTVAIVRLAQPLTRVEQAMNQIKTTIALAAGIITAIALVAAPIIARVTVRSIRTMTQAAKRIASGELDQRVPLVSRDEAGQLARAFNEMASALKELVGDLAQEHSKLAVILSNMVDGVLMTDKEGAIILANPAAQRLFNFEEKTALGRPLIEVTHDHELDLLLKACLRTAQEQRGQFEKLPERRFLQVIVTPLFGDGLTAALMVCQDLTEVRRLQTVRQDFIANVSHELRTPLASIKAVVETLREGAIKDKRLAPDFLARIEEEVERLTNLLRELTELSRIETGQAPLNPTPIDLAEVVAEVFSRLQPQADRQDVELIKDIPAILPPLKADIERVRQLLLNLVHNAIKFNHPGGKVTIAAETEGEWVKLRVIDTGHGISPEDLPHIFERFYKADRSRSGEGTGLGLAIAKHIVEAHGGRIWAESTPGQGSTFSLTLPLNRPNQST